MFVTVKYGDDQTEIFNPVCLNCNLLWAIKLKCKIEIEDTVDLSDEAGRVKQLHKRLTDYAHEYLEDRETLILLRVERDNEEGKTLKYTPLVTELLKDKEFIARLNPDRPRKSGSTNKRGGEDPKSGKRTAKQANKLSVNPPPGANMGRRSSRRMSSVGLPVKKS